MSTISNNMSRVQTCHSKAGHTNTDCAQAAPQPTESFEQGSGNPMADIAKLRDAASTSKPYGDNAGVGSTVERGGDLAPEEIPLICCYALES